VTALTGVVLSHLLYATANADEGTDVLRIDRARVLDGYDDSAKGVRIAPHLLAVDTDEPVVELVWAVVHQGDIADNNMPSAVDVDAPKGFDGKGGKPIAVACRMHPVFFGDKESAISGLDNTGGHGRRINVLDDARCLFRGLARCESAQIEKWKKAHDGAVEDKTACTRN